MKIFFNGYFYNYDKQKIVYSTKNPISATGGVVGLSGNLAPDGSIVKVAGMKSLYFKGKARCFDCEEDALTAVLKNEIVCNLLFSQLSVLKHTVAKTKSNRTSAAPCR